MKITGVPVVTQRVKNPTAMTQMAVGHWGGTGSYPGLVQWIKGFVIATAAM